MTDFDQFKKFFDSMDVLMITDTMMSEDARALATMTGEALAGHSSKTIMVGNTLFHFDWKGQYIGLESSNFEPREGIDAGNLTHPPESTGGQERGDNGDTPGNTEGDKEGSGS